MKIIMKYFIKILEIILRKMIYYKNLYSEDDHYEYTNHIKRLIDRGLRIGKNVTIAETAYIDAGYPYLISIGNNCSLASGVRLLAHDATPFRFTGYQNIGKIEIKDNCFISENCIILPGVTIGPNVIVAAGSVVNKDIPPNSCVAGVPARFYAKFDDYVERHIQQIQKQPIFDYYDLQYKKDKNLIKEVQKAVKDGICYVKGERGNRCWYTTWYRDGSSKFSSK
jgi:maltose O-acetyltransferase